MFKQIKNRFEVSFEFETVDYKDEWEPIEIKAEIAVFDLKRDNLVRFSKEEGNFIESELKKICINSFGEVEYRNVHQDINYDNLDEEYKKPQNINNFIWVVKDINVY